MVVLSIGGGFFSSSSSSYPVLFASACLCFVSLTVYVVGVFEVRDEYDNVSINHTSKHLGSALVVKLAQFGVDVLFFFVKFFG